MTEYPMLRFKSKETTTITEFGGINHTATCAPGEWYNAHNMSSRAYPVATTSGARPVQGTIGGYELPWLGILDMCDTEPPTYLSMDMSIWCGGHSVRPSTGGQTRTGYYGWCEADERFDYAGDSRFSITDTGAAAIMAAIGVRMPAVPAPTETLQEWDFQATYHEFGPVIGWKIVQMPTSTGAVVAEGCRDLSEFGITRISDVGRETDGDIFYIHILERYQQISPTARKMVQMGAYVVVWPDKIYCNAAKLASGSAMVEGEDYGSLDLYNTVEASNNAKIYCYLCTRDGTPLNTSNEHEDGAREESGRVFYGVNTPTIPLGVTVQDGDYWVQVLDSTYDNLVVSKYTSSTGWLPSSDIAVKLYHSGIGTGIKAGTSVVISGWDGIGGGRAMRAQINRGHGVIAAGADYLIIDHAFVVGAAALTMASGTVRVGTDVPDMEYVVECGNRLWGCHYGVDDNGNVINELYASALGEFRSWRQYQGLSTDSWTASRGSEGKWTGAAVLNGSPLFFKEKSMDKVFPSSSGAHQVQTISLDGVQDGCSRSLVVIDNKLYYKARVGVCVYTGNLPQHISYKLGDEANQMGMATAGRSGKRYVLDMQKDDVRRCYIYNIDTGLWDEEAALFSPAEDETAVQACLTYQNELYYSLGGFVWMLDRGLDDGPNGWYAETGNLGVKTGKRKYVSRIRIRTNHVGSGYLDVSISYDGKSWTPIFGRLNMQSGPNLINLFPHRCDRFRLRFAGNGKCDIQLIEYNVETGSDV